MKVTGTTTFTELGVYDTRNTIEYIMQKTSKSI